MNREQIIQMAREAKFATEEWGDGLHHVCVFNFQDSETEITKELEAFAKLVAEHEREACAKVCEDSVPTYLKDGERWLKGINGKPDKRLKELAPNLEAAWEAEQLLKNGGVVESITEMHKCADAIRARGQA